MKVQFEIYPKRNEAVQNTGHIILVMLAGYLLLYLYGTVLHTVFRFKQNLFPPLPPADFLCDDDVEGVRQNEFWGAELPPLLVNPKWTLLLDIFEIKRVGCVKLPEIKIINVAQ